MAAQYEVFEFQVRVGTSRGQPLRLKLHAPDRGQAWERVQQMHPNAVETRRVNSEKCEQSHTQQVDRQKITK